MGHKNLYCFQRDLRLKDHAGLAKAAEGGSVVCPVFIFDPRQLEEHPYFSSRGLLFLIESLEDLDRALQKKGLALQVFMGRPEEVLRDLHRKDPFDGVYCARDVTPFARQRSAELQNVCEGLDIHFETVDHLFLNGIEEVRKDDGLPYTVFTPYFRKASSKGWRGLPKALSRRSLENLDISGVSSFLPKEEWLKLKPTDLGSEMKGGTKEAERLLGDLPSASEYTTQRDLPACPQSTSRLSAHLKFGTISALRVRELLNALDPEHPLIRQLYWRDFLSQVAAHFPEVFEENFQKKTRSIVWPSPKPLFEAWCRGQTGFPLVDAAMRQLIQTGEMHNRCRMVVASFLVKDCHVDWRWGERFFAKHLIDYDPALNNGNWQWAASTGCDAQPYFRIFNPWLQQKKFDPEAEYIKTWVPELESFDAKAIHRHAQTPLLFYPVPIVDHSEAARRAKSFFA